MKNCKTHCVDCDDLNHKTLGCTASEQNSAEVPGYKPYLWVVERKNSKKHWVIAFASKWKTTANKKAKKYTRKYGDEYRVMRLYQRLP